MDRDAAGRTEEGLSGSGHTALFLVPLRSVK